MTQKNNHNLEQDLHALRSMLAPNFNLVTNTTTYRYTYIDWFRSYAPYAMAALLIAFFGFRGFPANGANDIASLDISSLDENIALAQLSFNEELAVANLEVDLLDIASDN